MKILHMADWHLGRRQGRIDRADDLRRAIGRVMAICETEAVDVLLIAGDLFDNVHRPDDLRAAVRLFKEGVAPFLARGGTILAVAGNHDGEHFVETLRDALALADPDEPAIGTLWPSGRFYLATRETFLTLRDGEGVEVQFVLVPYPNASRYLDDEINRVEGGLGRRNNQLRQLMFDRIARMQTTRAYRTDLHSLLVAHLTVHGATLPNGYRFADVDESGHIVCPVEGFDAGWTYVALGDVHKPQALGDRGHVRYSGSIERLALDERDDEKEVVLIEFGPGGPVGEPRRIPLETTPFLDVQIDDPSLLPALEPTYLDAAHALVRCRVAYMPGVDDPDAIHRWIDAVFPRCYQRDVTPIAAASPAAAAPVATRGLRETVLDHLQTTIAGDDPDRDAILSAAEELLGEVSR